MTGLPRISIVTPSFNQGRFLAATIESVLSQECENVEYIVIDGGSTDGSVDIIRRYANKLTYWVSEPDGGQADAIAKGFARSTGEIMGWLNADDLLLPGALATVARTFSRSLDIQMTYGDIAVVNEWGQMQYICTQTPARFESLYYGGQIINQEAVFWTRDLYNRVGGLNCGLQYALDYDLWIRMSRITMPHYIPAILAAFRKHPSQKSQRMDRYIDEMRLVQHRLRDDLGEAGGSFAVKSRRWRTQMALYRTARKLQNWFRSLRDNNRLLRHQVVSIPDWVQPLLSHFGKVWLFGCGYDSWLGLWAGLLTTAAGTTRRLRVQYISAHPRLVTSVRVRVGTVRDSRWRVMTDGSVRVPPGSGTFDVEIPASIDSLILIHLQFDRLIRQSLNALCRLPTGDPRLHSIRLIELNLCAA
jgi:glycosyltransferase involved in cell wall biosynthesis